MAIGALRAGNVAVVEAAIDHLNRIVTPFSTPWVRTVSIGWGS
jgi:histidinol-phosphate/aromatic aminotransferase/cobyric acid decarboxylase-like protein